MRIETRRKLLGRPRGGFTVFLLLVGMTVLATMMLIDRSGRLLTLISRQREILSDLHHQDRLNRRDRVSATDKILPGAFEAEKPGE